MIDSVLSYELPKRWYWMNTMAWSILCQRVTNNHPWNNCRINSAQGMSFTTKSCTLHMGPGMAIKTCLRKQNFPKMLFSFGLWHSFGDCIVECKRLRQSQKVNLLPRTGVSNFGSNFW